jgi:chromatin structure-remodeling complex subunit RSC4
VRLAHPLKGVFLKTEPLGRPFRLDHEEGVRTWAMRLGHGETAVSITDVTFLPADDDNADGSGEEDDHDDHDDDEGDESAMEVEAPAKNGRRKKKARGRAKGRAAVLTAKAKSKSNFKKPKTVLLPEDVQVKLNGSQVKAKEDANEEWYVELPVGSHVLEVGTKGGMVWKVFAEKVNV